MPLRWKTLLLLLVLLCAPLAAKAPPSVEEDLKVLNAVSPLHLEQIDPLLRIHQKLPRESVPPKLRLPDPWVNLLHYAVARTHVALMVENYEALTKECQQADWLKSFVAKARVALPTDHELPQEWVDNDVDAQKMLDVFARWQLRVLYPEDLRSLERNINFSDSARNRAELDLLAARSYLDQGQTDLFVVSLRRLGTYGRSADAIVPLQVAYHALAWRESGKSEDLLASTRAIVELGQKYHFGTDHGADVFWISCGDELVELARDLFARHSQYPELREEIEKLVHQLDALNYRWTKELQAADTDWLNFDIPSLFAQLEQRQAGVALFLTTEKLGLFLFPYRVITDSQRWEVLEESLKRLADCRRILASGFWLQVPVGLRPTEGDLWRGSALERIEAQVRVQRWKLKPESEPVRQLVDLVLSLSPQEEALELALDWSESLHEREPAAAYQLLEKAQGLAATYRFPAYRLRLLERHRQLSSRAGESQQELAVCREIIKASSQLVASNANLREGASPSELAQNAAERLAAAGLAEDQVEQAFMALEQGQAVRSAHQLTNDAARSRGEAGQAIRELRTREVDKAITERREALGESVGGAGDSARASFLKQSRELQSKYPDLYDRTLSVKPVELPRIQKHLPSEVVLVQYFPTDTTLYIFAATSEELFVYRQPVTKSALDTTLVSYLRALRRLTTGSEVTEISSQLYTQLLSPLQDQLEKKSMILLVPSGRLNYLPFGSLRDSQGRYFASTHRMAVLGKSSDLLDVATRESHSGTSLLVVADPGGDLPAAKQEGESLAALFPGGVALYREQATREALIRGMNGQSYLHLATHGEVDPADPGQNYLMLAKGQKLAAEDIFSLPLDGVQLVTLSACNTALGQAEPTASVVSLAENFWVTGPGSVVATLWAVNDESTSTFMQAFYQALREGRGKAEALQTAQIALQKNPHYHHPYYWSPFILLGDWR